MPMRGDPLLGCRFTVEIGGLIAGGFAECSGLSAETETETYPEGGVNDHVHHFAGRTLHPPLVLRRGITLHDGLWQWYAATRAGQVERLNGTVTLRNLDGSPALAWDFLGAFPAKWTGPELRADQASVAFESVELHHRGLWPSRVAGR
jgi:phage tail-like protein